MNDELQQALVEILEKGITATEAAGDFLQAELPDVISQLLLWHGVHSAIFFLLSLIIIYGLYRFGSWALAREGAEGFTDSEFPRVMCGLAFTALSPVLLNFTMNLDWLQILIAPKIFLIEYAARLAA